MKEFVVFYAWQSDTDQRLNRYLIRTALELAARNISADRVMNVPVRILTLIGHLVSLNQIRNFT